MRMHCTLAAALLMWTTNSLATEPSGNDTRAVDRAREALAKKLEEAKTEGVISIKRHQQDINESREDEIERILTPKIPYPTMLRDDYQASADCLTLTGLVTAAAAAADDPFGRIDRLIQTAADDGNTERHWINAQLAETYLAIGFFDEAYAASSKVDGPRGVATSIIAATALGSSITISKLPLLPEQCGKLHQLAEKIRYASEPMGLNFESSDLKLIESLPSPVAKSVFDYISVAAIDQGKLGIADVVREARKKLANDNAKSEAQSYVDAALLVSERPSIESAETLFSISTDPGPLRGKAIKHLVTSGAADLLNNEEQSALLANMEDAQAAITAGEWNASFGDALIDFRLKGGDWRGALELLGHRLENSKNDNTDALNAVTKILGDKLLGGNSYETLAALAFVADNPKLAAETLGEPAFEAAAKELSLLGSAEILDALLSFRTAGGQEDVRLRGDALLRSGKIEALNELLSERENDVKLLDLFAARSSEGAPLEMPNFPARVVSSPHAAKLIAEMAWAIGDWRSAAKFFRSANEVSSHKELSERAALALLASGETVTTNEAELKHAEKSSEAGLAHLFMSAPDADSGVALREFVNGVAQEIVYIRKKNVQ